MYFVNFYYCSWPVPIVLVFLVCQPQDLVDMRKFISMQLRHVADELGRKTAAPGGNSPNRLRMWWFRLKRMGEWVELIFWRSFSKVRFCDLFWCLVLLHLELHAEAAARYTLCGSVAMEPVRWFHGENQHFQENPGRSTNKRWFFHVLQQKYHEDGDCLVNLLMWLWNTLNIPEQMLEKCPSCKHWFDAPKWIQHLLRDCSRVFFAAAREKREEGALGAA